MELGELLHHGIKAYSLTDQQLLDASQREIGVAVQVVERRQIRGGRGFSPIPDERIQELDRYPSPGNEDASATQLLKANRHISPFGKCSPMRVTDGSRTLVRMKSLMIVALVACGCSSMHLGVVPYPDEVLIARRVEIVWPLDDGRYLAISGLHQCHVDIAPLSVREGGLLLCRWHRTQ